MYLVSPNTLCGSDLDRLFGTVWNDLWPRGEREVLSQNWSPSVEITENDKEVLLRAELPGVAPEAVDIMLDGDLLTISGKKEESKESNEENCHYSERFYGSFHRTITLPTSVQPETAEAAHKDGVLTVTLKKDPKLTPRKITVKSS